MKRMPHLDLNHSVIVEALRAQLMAFGAGIGGLEGEDWIAKWIDIKESVAVKPAHRSFRLRWKKEKEGQE